MIELNAANIIVICTSDTNLTGIFIKPDEKNANKYDAANTQTDKKTLAKKLMNSILHIFHFHSCEMK